tara:strand:+ start:1366 stop:2079 length:714 start_codon:yes stop_codon:yes gene_type:complete
MKLKVLGIIPARSGSKGVKNKNIKKLGKYPLIYYTICQSIKSKIFDDIIISTDSKKYLKIAEKYGVSSPFLRPLRLSTSRSLATETIYHSIKECERFYNKKYDLICMLQPTSPFRKLNDFTKIFKIIKNNYKKCDSVISVTDVDNYHPYKMKIISSNKLIDYKKWHIENPPRQSLPKTFIVNGAFYFFKRDQFMKKKSFKGKISLPYVMPKERSINIDNDLDFSLAEVYLRKLKIKF